MEIIAQRYDSDAGSDICERPAAQASSSDDGEGFHILNVTDQVDGENEKSKLAQDTTLLLEVTGNIRSTPVAKASQDEGSDVVSPSQDGPRTTEDSLIRDQNETLRSWINSMKGKSKQEPSFLEMIRRNKNFHNPAIFEKMISYCNIDPYGSHLTDRKQLDENAYHDKLEEIQNHLMEQGT